MLLPIAAFCASTQYSYFVGQSPLGLARDWPEAIFARYISVSNDSSTRELWRQQSSKTLCPDIAI